MSQAMSFFITEQAKTERFSVAFLLLLFKWKKCLPPELPSLQPTAPPWQPSALEPFCKEEKLQGLLSQIAEEGEGDAVPAHFLLIVDKNKLQAQF